MPVAIKGIVFKTAQLKATREFFENTLEFQIKESSVRHFVIYSKSIRLVFVESAKGFEVELYVNDRTAHFSNEGSAILNAPDLKSFKDPNGINIIITQQNV